MRDERARVQDSADRGGVLKAALGHPRVEQSLLAGIARVGVRVEQVRHQVLPTPHRQPLRQRAGATAAKRGRPALVVRTWARLAHSEKTFWSAKSCTRKVIMAPCSTRQHQHHIRTSTSTTVGVAAHLQHRLGRHRVLLVAEAQVRAQRPHRRVLEAVPARECASSMRTGAGGLRGSVKISKH